MQYVSIKFYPKDRRAYTYHNEDEPVKAGDRVEVATPHGKQEVTVISVSDTPPPFATKPILGLAPDKEETDDV